MKSFFSEIIIFKNLFSIQFHGIIGQGFGGVFGPTLGFSGGFYGGRGGPHRGFHRGREDYSIRAIIGKIGVLEGFAESYLDRAIESARARDSSDLGVLEELRNTDLPQIINQIIQKLNGTVATQNNTQNSTQNNDSTPGPIILPTPPQVVPTPPSGGPTPPNPVINLPDV